MENQIIIKNGDKLLEAYYSFNVKMAGLTLGSLVGMSIFIITNWLLIVTKGSNVVDPNLQLLSHIFIGYKVSFLGSIIGFVYGFILGTLSGFMIGWIYNKIASFRN